ncbi:MAG: C25 family cysteine peptidase, partial [Candidatus Cloacimonadales bacterium]|nr:C25 family cysteine peptidase [Candidatus Cloacimonadales bacterium]
MKRTWLLLVLIFAFSLNAEIIEQTYYFGDYKISQKDGYDFIMFENTQLAGKTGEPALPFQSIALLLPQGQIAAAIEITRNDEVLLPGNFELYPMQQSRPISLGASGEFYKNEAIYSSDEIFPAQSNGQLTTEFLNGFACVLSSFTPVSYIPNSGKVSFFREVTVKITTQSDPKFVQNNKNLKTSPQFLNKIENFVQNPEISSSYIPNQNNREGEYDILLITSPAFENEFDAWIEMNLQKGMITQVATTTDIYAAMAGQDEPEKIRNYIIQEYQDHDVSFVFLAGDAEVVPYRGFYCYVVSGGGTEDDNIPSDLYYSALDGTWNDDGDNLWGEVGEDDLLPDISVARLPFSDADELENMLFKTISYQTAPVLGELTNPLLAGEDMYNDPQTWGGDYMDLLIGWHDDNGYTTEGIPEDSDYLTMYDRDLGYWSAEQLMTEINEGHPFIYHAGHANYTYGLRLNDWQITNSNFSQVNGVDHNFPLIYTHGCNCGGFDVSDCIAEYMLKIDNFAAVFVGNSRYGWFNEGFTEGPSEHLNREFVDALYTDKTDLIARTHLESKIDTSPWVTAPGQWEEGALRWCFYDCNVLGDPTLPIWTDEPLELEVTYSPSLFLGEINYYVQVNGNGVAAEGLACTIIQNGELITTATTDAAGNATLEAYPEDLIPGEASLYISGNNCLITEYIIQIIPPGYYMNVESYSVSSGNDDVLEFGENVLLSMNLESLGNIGDVHNVVVTISTEDNYITVNDSTETIAIIPEGTIVGIDNAFNFDLSTNIPDDYSFEIEVIINCDEGGWISWLYFMAFAADIHMESVMIDDGDNGVLDPGETAVMQMELMNTGGADVYNVQLVLQTSNPFVSLEMLPFQIDSINSNGSVTSDICNITLDASAPLGEIIQFELDITADNGYFTDNDFSLITGMSIEDFESGDFTVFDWTFTGNADWMIDTEAYEGTYSARSGSIGNNSESSIEITLQVTADSDISFWKKVSSEADYDYLRFYIDAQLQDEWSGEVEWSEENYNVTIGEHTFTWTYFKDQGVASGDDCAWIDYIIFPAIQANVPIEENILPTVTKLLGNYPNPFNPTTTISFELNTSLRQGYAGQSETAENTELVIYNLKGQKVKTFPVILSGVEGSAGQHSVIWNGKDDQG